MGQSSELLHLQKVRLQNKLMHQLHMCLNTLFYHFTVHWSQSGTSRYSCRGKQTMSNAQPSWPVYVHHASILTRSVFIFPAVYAISMKHSNPSTIHLWIFSGYEFILFIPMSSSSRKWTRIFLLSDRWMEKSDCSKDGDVSVLSDRDAPILTCFCLVELLHETFKLKFKGFIRAAAAEFS